MTAPSEIHVEVAARTGADLTGLWSDHGLRNAELIAPFSGANAAVLECHFEATGNAKRRLLRRLNRDLSNANTSTKGRLHTRIATPFEWLTHDSALAELLALDSGARLVGWRLLSHPS